MSPGRSMWLASSIVPVPPGGSSRTRQHPAASGTSRFGTGRVPALSQPCTAHTASQHCPLVSFTLQHLPAHSIIAQELLGVCRGMHRRSLIPTNATLASAKVQPQLVQSDVVLKAARVEGPAVGSDIMRDASDTAAPHVWARYLVPGICCCVSPALLGSCW